MKPFIEKHQMFNSISERIFRFKVSSRGKTVCESYIYYCCRYGDRVFGEEERYYTHGYYYNAIMFVTPRLRVLISNVGHKALVSI